MVKWFIDSQLIGSWNNSNHISQNVGRVTLGTWIPGRDSFCGIPNFDKSFMELDYFKYTPFTNQINNNEPAGLNPHTQTYRTITSSPEIEFIPNGHFNYGLPSYWTTYLDVEAATGYDMNNGADGSYGVKISGSGRYANSYLRYMVPNVRGIERLKFKFNYRGYGSCRAYADGLQILGTGTLASRNEWTTFEAIVELPITKKNLIIYIDSESGDFGFFVDNVSVTYPNVVRSNYSSHSFLTVNNGQTSQNNYDEELISPNSDTGQLWKISNCKYYKQDDLNLLMLQADNKVMGSESGSYYYPFKNVLSSLYTSSENLSLMAMEFDVNDFKDVEFDFYDLTSTSTLTLLFSIDNGASWDVFDSYQCSSLSEGISPFKHSLRVSSSDITNNKTIRFALVSNSSDPISLVSCTINNYQNFIEKLDGQLCSADEYEKMYLANQYSKLTSEELETLNSTQMENYSQSYGSGYSYLLSYWNSSTKSRNSLETIIKSDGRWLITIIAVSTGSLIVIGLIAINKKRKISR